MTRDRGAPSFGVASLIWEAGVLQGGLCAHMNIRRKANLPRASMSRLLATIERHFPKSNWKPTACLMSKH